MSQPHIDGEGYRYIYTYVSRTNAPPPASYRLAHILKISVSVDTFLHTRTRKRYMALIPYLRGDVEGRVVELNPPARNRHPCLGQRVPCRFLGMAVHHKQHSVTVSQAKTDANRLVYGECLKAGSVGVIIIWPTSG